MRAIAWIGILVFAAAWFCPVVEGQDFFKTGAKEEQTADGGTLSIQMKDTQLPAGPDWLPGWEACRFAWQFLVEGSPAGTGETSSGWKDRVRGATSLTNVLMVLGLLLLLGQRSGNPLMGLLMLAAAGLNASWIYLSDDPSAVMKDLKIGYWLWAGSFALVGLGLMAGRSDDGYVAVQQR